MIEATFAAFGIGGLLLFRFMAPAGAVATICMAGWLLLPVGHFPPGSAEADFPYWITGVAIPSDMLLTKMWWPPVVALAGVLLADRQVLGRWRPCWMDTPILLWCVWPLGQWPLAEQPSPQPWISSLYLAAAWGAPWLLGRLYFSGSEGGVRLLRAISAGLVLLAPIALLEGFLGPRLYSWVYELHPFRYDGIQRYFGFRPLGFFEDGNQYGIWVAATALAAIWQWRANYESSAKFRFAAAATVGLAIALASQSVGAILLLFAGLGLLRTMGHPLMRRMIWVVLILALGGGAIYLSGAIPFQKVAKDTAVGRKILDLARSAGRQSITWRIARDQRALTLVAKHPVVGTGRWNWWEQNGERPWGLAVLILGQFGVVGLLLSFGSLLFPALRALNVNWALSKMCLHAEVPLATIVLMSFGDALLNSFIFYPAVLAAGALVDKNSVCQFDQTESDFRKS